MIMRIDEELVIDWYLLYEDKFILCIVMEQLNFVHCVMVVILMKWRFRYHFLSLLSLLIHHFSLLLVLLQISSLFWSFILLCNWRTKEEDCQEIKKEKEKRRGGREGTWKALHAEVHGASNSLGFNLCSSCFALSLWPLWSINRKEGEKGRI